MEQSEKHIRGFVNLLWQNGYQDYFYLQSTYAGPLIECLRYFLSEGMKANTDPSGFDGTLSTTIQMQNGDSSYKRGHFKIHYQAERGFTLTAVAAEHKIHGDTVAKLEFDVLKPSDIPSKYRLCKMVQMPHGKKHVHKF